MKIIFPQSFYITRNNARDFWYYTYGIEIPSKMKYYGISYKKVKLFRIQNEENIKEILSPKEFIKNCVNPKIKRCLTHDLCPKCESPLNFDECKMCWFNTNTDKEAPISGISLEWLEKLGMECKNGVCDFSKNKDLAKYSD